MTMSGDVPGDSGFNVREFARTARGNHREELDLVEFSDHPLDAATLEKIRFLARLESATMEHLRNLLVTATHKDARVTAFLVTWAFEKFWIADALDAILVANGQPRSHEIVEGPPRRKTAEAVERRGPIRRAILALGMGVPIIAVHTTSGLIDEWVMATAYERLAAETTSSSLRSAIRIILEVKKRHASFFADETQRRLAESSRAVKQTQHALPHTVFPIGAVDRAAEDRDMFENWLFTGDEGATRIASIAERISALPHLGGATAAAVASRLRP